MFLTKRECARAEREKLQELDDSERNPHVDICLMELFNHRLDYLQLTRSLEYYRDNKRLSKKILKVWGNLPVSDVTKKMVIDLILSEVKRCRREGLSTTSWSPSTSPVGSFFDLIP